MRLNSVLASVSWPITMLFGCVMSATAQTPIVPYQTLVVSSYDKIEDQTRFYTDTLAVEVPGPGRLGLLKFHLAYVAAGKSAPSPLPPAVGIIWESTFGRPRFSSGNEVVLLVDDSIRIRGTPSYSSDYGSGIFFETLIEMISLSELKTLANAKTISGRVGSVPVEFNEYQRATLKAFLEVLQGVRAPRGSHPEAFLTSEVDKKPKWVKYPFDAPAPLAPAGKCESDEMVSFQFLVDSTGTIVMNTLSVVTPAPDVFLGPSSEAIQKWKFTPGKKDGRAVNVWMRVGFYFSAQSRKASAISP